MDKKYVFLQPEYYSRFKCDGQKCGAHCCQGWNIPIDETTYNKYRKLKPKSEAKKVLAAVRFNENIGKHVIKFAENGKCPMLTSDCWCSLQKKYGEEILSDICRTYPRVIQYLGSFIERSLTLTCPVAAELIFGSDEPLSFEQIELGEKEAHRVFKLTTFAPDIPSEMLKHFFSVQYASISILQARNLSIDGRLIVLGFFLDRLDELRSAGRFDEIEQLVAVYSSEEFLQSESARLIADIEFDAVKYIRMMFNLLESIYGEGSEFNHSNRRYIDAIRDVLEIKVDENNGVSLSKIAANYQKLSSARSEFLKKNSIRLEHYLVNEFFLGVYPWKTPYPILQNYGIFVATYKILELIALSLDVQWQRISNNTKEMPEEYQLLPTMMQCATNVDHNAKYLSCVLEHLEKDVLTIMRSLLDG